MSPVTNIIQCFDYDRSLNYRVKRWFWRSNLISYSYDIDNNNNNNNNQHYYLLYTHFYDKYCQYNLSNLSYCLTRLFLLRGFFCSTNDEHVAIGQNWSRDIKRGCVNGLLRTSISTRDIHQLLIYFTTLEKFVNNYLLQEGITETSRYCHSVIYLFISRFK